MYRIWFILNNTSYWWVSDAIFCFSSNDPVSDNKILRLLKNPLYLGLPQQIGVTLCTETNKARINHWGDLRPDKGLVFVSGHITHICIQTNDSYLYPDKRSESLFGQRTRICVRIKDTYLYAEKCLQFLSGQRTRICVRTKDLYL